MKQKLQQIPEISAQDLCREIVTTETDARNIHLLLKNRFNAMHIKKIK